ncbi:ethionine resistance protein, partial [Coemansia helicoidea]
MFFPLEFQILALALLAALGWSAALQVLAWSGVDARQALQLAQLPAGNAEPGDGGLSRGVARLAAALALLSAAGWLLSACSPAPGVRTGIALLTYLALLAALAQPRRALCRAVRMQLAGLLARIVKPSLSDPVCLADIIMADALTSCSRMLADAAVVACQFGALLWRSGHACSGAGVAGALLASAPFAFRLRQCVNEYLKAPAGSPDARRHLANAIKYASSFPVIALAAARPHAVAAAAHPGWAPQTVLFLWVAAATANSLYSFYWDVAFDWDLGHTHSGWKLADLVVPAGCAASPGVPDPPTRGLVATTSVAVLAAPALWYIEPLLLILRQDATVAALCAMYTRIQLLGVLPWLFFECVKRFLQAQGIMHASTLVLVAATPVHLASSYLLTQSPWLGVGMAGAAAAGVLTNWLMLAGIVAYVRQSKARSAWGGWSAQALWAMPQYFRLAVPSTIMVCAEWWVLDLLSLAAGYLGSVPLAAQSIIVNTCGIAYQIPDSLSVAVCNRTGNLLGQAQPRRAKIAAWLGIFLGAAVGAAMLCAGLAVRGWWGRVYSDDRQVVACVAAAMPACATFQMLDSINSVGSGVLRGLGRQNAGAAINFPAYYVVGLPLGLYLTYGAPRAGLAGLWLGLCAGVGLAVAGQLLVCARTRWG